MAEGLSIIVPVYNEESSIGQTIEFFSGLAEKHRDFEVIFIDDGSRDKTSEALKALKHDRVKVLTHPKNKGYGGALKSGIRESSHPYIAITDGDASYPNEKIPDMFQTALREKAVMVVGSRTGKTVEIAAMRKFAKYFLRKLAEYLAQEEIPDLNSGLRIIKKDAIVRFLRFFPNGFSFTSSTTLSFMAYNYKIIYTPINYFKRKGKSKIRPVKDTISFFQLIIRTVMFFNPLKVFFPISVSFILAALLVLIVSYILGNVMDITTILLFVTGLNFLAIGMVADLIAKRLE
ncbi:glycosyltransferase family 2 protein [Candidatus Omnitrophota bacterium]